MKKIQVVYLYYFRDEAHGEYMVVFRNLSQKFTPVMNLLVQDFGNFKNLLDEELKLINAMKKSDYTEPITDAGQRIDRIIVGMNMVIESALHHFDDAVVTAAKSLKNRFADFGHITRKSYEEEILDVNLLIADLLSVEYSTKVNTVGLKPWLTKLQSEEASFEQLLDLRNVETSVKPKGQVKTIRRDVDVVYHRMIDRLNAAAMLDTSATYDTFIAQLNAQITYFNDRYHHAAKNISTGGACTIEAIPTQLYTGTPLTPLTKVYYREEGQPTLELVFAKDYFVTYRNNIEIGTATLAIHGKGAYRGQVAVKFNIARRPESQEDEK
jgi:hypothetical protein